MRLPFRLGLSEGFRGFDETGGALDLTACGGRLRVCAPALVFLELLVGVFSALRRLGVGMCISKPSLEVDCSEALSEIVSDVEEDTESLSDTALDAEDSVTEEDVLCESSSEEDDEVEDDEEDDEDDEDDDVVSCLLS